MRTVQAEDIKKWLEEAHLKVEGIYDSFTLNQPDEKSERITFVAREIREKQRYIEEGEEENE